MYDEPSVPEIEIHQLAKFLEEVIGSKVEVRKNIFEYCKADRKTAHELASMKIMNPYASFERHEPTIEETNFEEESFSNSSASNNITLYDGFELQNFLKGMIPEQELQNDIFQLVFTSRLTCTYDYEDYRYHGRAVICANPSIISTTGIIEAPAKPRDYYLALYQNMAQGVNLDILKEQFKGKFLEYHDKNLAKVVRGYTLQAIFYYLTAEPFCESRDCVLHNAHWQEDLIHSQIELGRLCEKHQKFLESIRIS